MAEKTKIIMQQMKADNKNDSFFDDMIEPNLFEHRYNTTKESDKYLKGEYAFWKNLAIENYFPKHKIAECVA